MDGIAIDAAADAEEKPERRMTRKRAGERNRHRRCRSVADADAQAEEEPERRMTRKKAGERNRHRR